MKTTIELKQGAGWALSHLRMAYDLEQIGDCEEAQKYIHAARMELVNVLEVEPDRMRGEVVKG